MTEKLIVNAAETYTGLGWHVVPVLGKIPQGGTAWQNNTLSNPDYAQSYFENFSYDGLGVLLGPLSGIVDIECDNDEAEYTLLEFLGGEIPNTPTFQSIRGSHRLFKWREGLPDKSVFKIKGLEFRIGGRTAAQSVFPPSGSRYWEIPAETEVMEFPAWDKVLEAYESNKKRKVFDTRFGDFAIRYGDGIALDVPRWLHKNGRDIIGRNESTDGTTRWFIECPNSLLHTTQDGKRDCCVTQKLDGTLGGCCFHQSCGMSDWNALRDTIGKLEHSDYQEEGDDEPMLDLSGFEVEPVAEYMEVESEEPTEIASVADLVETKPVVFKFPLDCMNVPGLVGEIINYNLRTALCPRPELALAGALAMMSLITGRKVEDRWELRTNMYFVGLCGSGGGKSWAKTVNNRILGAIGAQDMIMPKPKSGSALVTCLNESPSSLLQVDELADWMETMKNPQKSPHLAEVLGVMKEVFSEATNEYWKPASYADSKKNPTISCPHFAFYGVAPADIFYQSLTKANLRDGLVGRFTVIECQSDNDPNDDKLTEAVPPHILDCVRSWLNFAPGGDLATINPKPVMVQHTESAWSRYKDHRNGSMKRRMGESEEAYALWVRTPEKTGKLAMLRACSRTLPKSGILPVIELEDVEWAIKLSNWCTSTTLTRAGLYVAENQVEENLLRILRLLSDWRSKEWIGSKCRFLKTRERDEIIRGAIADGMIACREVPTGGRNRSEYRAVCGPL